MSDRTPLSPAAQRLRRPWPDVEACVLPDLPDPHVPGLGGRPARVARVRRDDTTPEERRVQAHVRQQTTWKLPDPTP